MNGSTAKFGQAAAEFDQTTTALQEREQHEKDKQSALDKATETEKSASETYAADETALNDAKQDFATKTAEKQRADIFVTISVSTKHV